MIDYRTIEEEIEQDQSLKSLFQTAVMARRAKAEKEIKGPAPELEPVDIETLDPATRRQVEESLERMRNGRGKAAPVTSEYFARLSRKIDESILIAETWLDIKDEAAMPMGQAIRQSLMRHLNS